MDWLWPSDIFTGIFSSFGTILGELIAFVLALIIIAFYVILAIIAVVLLYAIIKAAWYWICRLFVWAFPDGSSTQRWFNDILKKLG